MSMQPEGGRYSIGVVIEFDIDEVPDSVKKLRPVIYSDANMFLCQLGTNLFEGITGHGRTPQEAMANFDEAFQNWLAEGKIPDWLYYKGPDNINTSAVPVNGKNNS
jgi:hypothetical protein